MTRRLKKIASKRFFILKSDLAADFLSFVLQDSAVECSSPAVCIKDSLYPLRKELLNKPVQSTKPEGSKTRRPDDPNLKARKTLKSGTIPSTAPMTRARSRETVINSPWIKSDIPPFSEEMKIEKGCGSSMQDAEGAMANEETRKMEETGQSCVRTRGQKRKLSFKENYEVQVSFVFPLLVSSLCRRILLFLWPSLSNIFVELGSVLKFFFCFILSPVRSAKRLRHF